jgi:hypothetical protein
MADMTQYEQQQQQQQQHQPLCGSANAMACNIFTWRIQDM